MGRTKLLCRRYLFFIPGCLYRNTGSMGLGIYKELESICSRACSNNWEAIRGDREHVYIPGIRRGWQLQAAGTPEPGHERKSCCANNSVVVRSFNVWI